MVTLRTGRDHRLAVIGIRTPFEVHWNADVDGMDRTPIETHARSRRQPVPANAHD